MKNVPMRFSGFTFHHNPGKLKITNTANIADLVSPCCTPDSVHLGRKLRKVSGEGELYGADCLEEYTRLERLYNSGEKGILCLPHMPSMYAYLEELCMSAEPVEDVLTYRFVFTEAMSPRSSATQARYHVTTVSGESLWDISCSSGVDIGSLIHLNPQIRYIDDLAENERVRLC